jgi:peptide-methionine (R)-S-oxide reductase
MNPVPLSPITRRALWAAPLAAGAAAVTFRNLYRTDSLPAAESATDREITIVRFDDRGQRIESARVERVVHSDAEWRALLTPQQYYVTRQRQTDPAFSGSMFRLHEPGLFRCICCGEALFSSDSKYDSGTGWPSFTAPIAMENLRTRREPLGMLALGIEVVCARCGAHLGHVFNDGPAPGHLRYCINESSLRFVAASSVRASAIRAASEPHDSAPPGCPLGPAGF